MQGRVARWCRALLAASLVSPVAVVLAGPAWLGFEAVSARSARAAEPAQATAPELRGKKSHREGFLAEAISMLMHA